MREEVEKYQKEDIIETDFGKKVFEIKPNLDWDKGKAVSLLLDVLRLDENTLPVYFGDDITDEDAFFSLGNRGIGILVSETERETGADYRLNNVEEVEEFLRKLKEFLRRN